MADDMTDRPQPLPATVDAPTPRGAPAFRRWRRIAMGLALVLFAGMLFWAKLRLVSDVPRSAYADPDAVERAAQTGGDAVQSADSAPTRQPAPSNAAE